MITRYARWRARTARHPGTRAYWVRWLWWDAKTVVSRDNTPTERYTGSTNKRPPRAVTPGVRPEPLGGSDSMSVPTRGTPRNHRRVI